MSNDPDSFVNKPLGRRQFINKGLAFVAGAGLAFASPSFVRAAFNEEDRNNRHSNVLVVLQLGGGNDGLNTVIPYEEGDYHDARKQLGLYSDDLHLIDGRIALHPALTGIKTLYDSGDVSIVEGVGYPDPNRSHFRSMDIWHTGSTNADVDTGWLGRMLDVTSYEANASWRAVDVGKRQSRALSGSQSFVPAIDSVPSYVFQHDKARSRLSDTRLQDWLQLQSAQSSCGAQQAAYGGQLAFLSDTGINAYQSTIELQSAASDYQPLVEDPDTPVASALKTCSELINSNLGTGVCYVTTGGFDTHGQQLHQHTNLLNGLSEAVLAFQKDLRAHGMDRRVTTMIWSEFGRRFSENGSGGTDHGTSSSVFLIGKRVSGGIQGEPPSFKTLDERGDLRHTIDFRRIYSTLLEDLFLVEPKDILDDHYQTLPLFT